MSTQDDFQGIALHSSQYQTADEWRGKKGVVIGTANTGNNLPILSGDHFA